MGSAVSLWSDDGDAGCGVEVDLEEPVDPGGREASVNSPVYVSCERVLSRNVLIATAGKRESVKPAPTPGMATHRPRLSASLPLTS